MPKSTGFPDVSRSLKKHAVQITRAMKLVIGFQLSARRIASRQHAHMPINARNSYQCAAIAPALFSTPLLEERGDEVYYVVPRGPQIKVCAVIHTNYAEEGRQGLLASLSRTMLASASRVVAFDCGRVKGARFRLRRAQHQDRKWNIRSGFS